MSKDDNRRDNRGFTWKHLRHQGKRTVAWALGALLKLGGGLAIIAGLLTIALANIDTLPWRKHCLGNGDNLRRSPDAVRSFLLRLRQLASLFQQRPQLRQYFMHYRFGCDTGPCCLPSLPIQATHLIGKHHTGYT